MTSPAVETAPAHAILSASGAHRWMACPPSARLEAELPDSTSSYAEEGTCAHALAELELGYWWDRQHAQGSKAVLEKRYRKRRAEIEANPYYSPEMVEHVGAFVDLVIERINESRARTADAVVFFEQRLNFSEWVPDGFGTGDVVIIADGVLEVIDLKYGQGVPVSAEGNPQLRLYGLGAYSEFNMLYDIERVRMTIVQPRLDSVSTDELTAAGLLNWAETAVRPRAELAWRGEGAFAAGEHCRFCRIRATCRARAEANLDLARHEFKPPAELSHDEIAVILGRADELQKWAGDVQAYALEQAEKHGVKFPGWKLVEGRSNRKYTDEAAVAITLTEHDYTEDQIFEKKLLGITAMEKLLGKRRFVDLLSDLVIKPAGKPTLVPESDKRPEINSAASAQADFK